MSMKSSEHISLVRDLLESSGRYLCVEWRIAGISQAGVRSSDACLISMLITRSLNDRPNLIRSRFFSVL